MIKPQIPVPYASRRVFLCGATAASALAVLPGCATKVKANAITNPPPSQPFSAFSRIELKPVRAEATAHADAADLTKIQNNLVKDLGTSLQDWNRGPDNGSKLIIEPVVTQWQFKGVGMRVFFGPLAGSSGVLMELRISDQQGRQIAKPQFFQRADAWAAGFVVGVHDNLMLTRVANLASRYIIDNYAQARGGPTGADDKAIAAQ